MKTMPETVLNVGRLKKTHHMRYPICPCGNREVVTFIGQVPSCQPCMDKDKVAHEMGNRGMWEADIERAKQEVERLKI
jgi:hypothetical protein